jgi:hypothetical protein
MTPTDSDRAGAGDTKVDLQAPRRPASRVEILRGQLHRTASRWAVRLQGRTDKAAQEIVALCDHLRGALTALTTAERERDTAQAAQQFADARVEFMQRGAVEQQRQISALRTLLKKANDLIASLTAQQFEERTPACDSSASVRAELKEFESQATRVRGGSNG